MVGTQVPLSGTETVLIGLVVLVAAVAGYLGPSAAGLGAARFIQYCGMAGRSQPGHRCR